MKRRRMSSLSVIRQGACGVVCSAGRSPSRSQRRMVWVQTLSWRAASWIETPSSLLPWSGTFHAIGSRLLRLHAGPIGLDPTFTVLDRADSADLLDFVRSERGLSLVKLRRAPAPTHEPASPEPLRFKVVDVMSAQVLGEDIDVREAVGLLEAMHSVLDARIFVRSPGTGRWRLLGLDEQKALWRFRGRSQAATL